MADVLGVAHVAGTYHLTDGEFLSEGADQVLALGSRVVKLYLFQPQKNYPFNARWPEMKTLVDIAASPPYRAVFGKPFTTYILTTYSLGRPEHYWREGVTAEQKADEQRQFRELAGYLLRTYAGTGKTFVLQHWEGDWAIRGNYEPKTIPPSKAVQGMIDWLNARQAGVDEARRLGAHRGVNVYHAAEVNLVVQAMRDSRGGVVDLVLPHAPMDLVSYSAWDAQDDPATLRAALDFIARHAPARPPFGARNVYIGEFGRPENDATADQVRSTIRSVTAVARQWGCPYAVYWQVYCNEPRRQPVRTSADCRGFWLVRPDDTRGPAWACMQELLRGG
jgi:hypothetical protein